MASPVSMDNVARVVEEINNMDNPMENELIVANICKYLDWKNLKVCRSLNTVWKQETDTFFSKLCPPLTLVCKGSRDKMTLFQFMKIYANPNHTHFLSNILRRYRDFRLMDLTTQRHAKAFYNFLVKVGPQIRFLELCDARLFHNPQKLCDLIFSKYTPNIESLRLEFFEPCCPSRIFFQGLSSKFDPIYKHQIEQKNLRQLHISWGIYRYLGQNLPLTDLLSVYPNLKTLSVENFDINHLEEIATALATFRQEDDTMLNLTDLKLGEEVCILFDCYDREAITKRIYQQLKAANVSLEKLGMKFIKKYDHDQGAFSSFLESQSVNLECLELDCEHPHPFPYLESLKKLQVWDCDNFGFLSQLPNLISMEMRTRSKGYIARDEDDDGYMPIVFPIRAPLPITSLTVFKDSSFKKWKDAELDQLILWMPNINVLKLALEDGTFSWVCQNIPKLKELEIYCDELSDSAVIGENVRMVDGEEVVERFPGVTNLKELETFIMSKSERWNRPVGWNLTGESIIRGFALMPKLSTLGLWVGNPLDVQSKLALERIKNVYLASDED